MTPYTIYMTVSVIDRETNHCDVFIIPTLSEANTIVGHSLIMEVSGQNVHSTLTNYQLERFFETASQLDGKEWRFTVRKDGYTSPHIYRESH